MTLSIYSPEVLEALSIYSPEELEALFFYVKATPEEQAKLMRLRKYNRLAEKQVEAVDNDPALQKKLKEYHRKRMRPEDEEVIRAMQFMIRGFQYLQQSPEVQRNALVAKAMQAIYDSVVKLSIFDMNEEAILDAFAAPALSVRNAKRAKKLRTTDEDLSDALALYKRWENEPGLYETKTAFARDCMKNEFCQDIDTPKRWLARWSIDLADDHPLRKKLGALKKR